MMVRIAEKKDLETLVKLAKELWEHAETKELTAEFEELISKQDAVFLLKVYHGEVVGFAQVQLRNDYVEGCETSPVGYLEGIFISEKFRNKGFAKELLSKAELWAKERGLTEFASDCEQTNTESIAFHKKVGFKETNRIVCFKKELK